MQQNSLVCIICCLVPTCFARAFSKCDIVYELRELGYAENEMKNLVCLIEMFHTHKLSGSGPHDYELLHVDDHYWCNDGPFSGRGCDVPCSDLLLDDITIAASCAKSLLSKKGGNPWYIWEIYCRAARMPAHGC